MQRRAERAEDQRDQRAGRSSRLSRALVGAATVPVLLIAAGCSSDSDSGDDAKKASESAASTSASPSPTVQAAVYGTLPEPCRMLAKKTLEDLVPEGTKGKEGSSDDTSTRANCSWDSLDNNGVKGSQFRWLNVALLRFDSDVSRGAGDERAREYYAKQVEDARAADGARNTKAEPLGGTGDEATLVRYDLKKKEGAFKQQTVVARVENVVITLDYNGAGLAGDKTPDGDDLAKAATKAAKEAVAALKATLGDAGGTSASPSQSASKSASAAKKD
ncbi:DUF3558 family protein [Streptomyces sp. NPDC006997]|uniref:DUF3558 family protein n=1 Tax=Streptomyces sp. NPDC006997 TaxID=3155356 RepID=UPI00340620D9